ncbi:MAG: cellobiose phosphorylase [Lachnospiraceae bacterium]|nr:cellobiose phosphorylase [Lachnospiraceae bacterium]
MAEYKFLDKNGSFIMENAESDRSLYFPLASEKGLKSALTPNLGGDSKIDQNHFLLEPVSADNLHNNRSTRNFWVKIDRNDKSDIWSATGMSALQEAMAGTEAQDKSQVEAGIMWHKTKRISLSYGVSAEITSFIPVETNVEIMLVGIKNESSDSIKITPTAAIPLYGRSADNIRDHRHVTAMLHRDRITEYGVEVTPTLSFDERGHNVNDMTYYVCGMEGDGLKPVGFFPEVADFIGKGGSFIRPEAVYTDKEPSYIWNGEDLSLDGQETVGAIKFGTKELKPGETAEYVVFLGICSKEQSVDKEIEVYNTADKAKKALEYCKQYWLKKCTVKYETGDVAFDRFMDWVNFQPELRRLFGCSFLPHHDYGKGGRGWRDLWQDCLALLIMNPAGVREMLIGNFGGVRVDGTNATIIGEKQGEFKADRNSITRVWMDHGVWPLETTKLYIDQTGDINILLEKVPYFKDRQVARGTQIDTEWNNEKWQLDVNGEEYKGTILEHLLLQNLAAFYEVGEHNHIRLRDADWNDAIDMASKRGESVAFTNAYAMNLQTLADILKKLKEDGMTGVSVFEEMAALVGSDVKVYDSIETKLEILAKYVDSCRHTIKGSHKDIDIDLLIADLESKSKWLKENIRKTEWVEDSEGNGWFNGYYDNSGNRVEGIVQCCNGNGAEGMAASSNGNSAEGATAGNNVRMMLTGQVFSIMAGTASDDQVKDIVKSADKYLYDRACGGYRLNTDFKEVKTDMGRMFGFAYGEKENGAVFSHMAVMYANALYRRGFAKEGFKSLEALYAQSMDFGVSRIYPGIPEYFGRGGRGLYHYLTGAASWYMLTVVTQMFGVRGEYGNLVINPKLLNCQFNDEGKAYISLTFGGTDFKIEIINESRLEVGDYSVTKVEADGLTGTVNDGYVIIGKGDIEKVAGNKAINVKVFLG